MGQFLIMVSSITQAIKGRDLLRSTGHKSYIEKTPGHLDTHGCGYSIIVYEQPDGLLNLLKSNGIKVIGTLERK